MSKKGIQVKENGISSILIPHSKIISYYSFTSYLLSKRNLFMSFTVKGIYSTFVQARTTFQALQSIARLYSENILNTDRISLNWLRNILGN